MTKKNTLKSSMYFTSYNLNASYSIAYFDFLATICLILVDIVIVLVIFSQCLLGLPIVFLHLRDRLSMAAYLFLLVC